MFHYLKRNDNILAEALSRLPSSMANTLSCTDSSAPARLPPPPPPPPFEKITEALIYINTLELAECLAEMPLSERQPAGPHNDVVPDLYHDCLLFHHDFDPQKSLPFHFTTIHCYQQCDPWLQDASKHDEGLYTQCLGSFNIICYRASSSDWKIALPSNMLGPLIQWYHKTLAHAPGMDRLEALVKRTFYHPKIRDACRSIVSSCPISLMVRTTYKPYGHLAPRNAPIIPWSEVHVDCIRPWKVSLPDNNTIKFYALTCLDPVTNLIEILRFHGPPTAEKTKLLAIPVLKRSSMTTVLNSLVMTSNFPSIMPALSQRILASIPQHPTRSLKHPTKSLAKFYEPYSLSITQLPQHRLITFLMRLSLQRCKPFIAPLTPLLATTHLVPWFSSAICFLTYPLLQTLLLSLANARPRLTPASLRLTPEGLSTTTPSATKVTTAISTATNWTLFALVHIRSSAFTPTIPSPFNSVIPMNAFPFVILLRSACLKIPSCGRMSMPVCHLSTSGSPLA